MKKSILIRVSIATVAAILLGAFALGFAGNSTKLNAFVDAQVNEQVMEKAIEVTSNSAPAPAREKTPEEAISEAQAKVSFKIVQPSYVPEGYALNIPQVSGTKFRGVSVELEQAMLPYTNGKETLNLKEFQTINDTVPKSTAIPEDIREIVDINGINGRYAEETNGVKYLNWKIGELSLTISSLTYDSNNIAGSSLGKEEMIKMARSVK